MKNNFLIACMAATLLLSCTHSEKGGETSLVIDIEKGLQNTTRLNVSDFGKKIRYVPLETTDSCLVGNKPIIKVLKNYIVIEANKTCLLFDKKDGRFISTIGHTGQDPQAFSSAFSWTDEKEEYLYFRRQPNKIIKYDMRGLFSDAIEIPAPPGLASYFLLSDEGIIGHYNGINNTNHYALAFFDKEGVLLDSIPNLIPEVIGTVDEIANISVTHGNKTYGNWTKTGAIIIDYKNGNSQIIAADATTLWRSGGNVRFKEDFVDTIYTIANRQLLPSITFHTGKWHWPEEERRNKSKSAERIFIADVSENDTFVFFQCIRGLLSDNPVLYHGLFNKKTGETKLGKAETQIQDDLSDFMPFDPLGISTSGEFISLLEAGAIMDWLDEHPEVANNEKLSFLKDFKEDMNPVVILVE